MHPRGHSNVLSCRAWRVREALVASGVWAQCLGMMRSTDLTSVPADHPAPFTDQLRLAVAAFFRHGHRFGFLLRDGTYTTISVPGSAGTYASDVSAAGVIVGGYFDAGGHYQGFLLSHGRYYTFNDPTRTGTENTRHQHRR